METFIDTSNPVFQEFFVNCYCVKCRTASTIANYCEDCHRRENERFLNNEAQRLNLARIDKIFADKYGVNFSIDDYEANDPETENIKRLITGYIQKAKEDSFSKSGAIFIGKQGTAKSMLCNLIKYEFIKMNKSTHMDTQYSIYKKLLKGEADEAYYIAHDLLIIEEIGRTTKTDPTYNSFFDIIEKRIKRRKQTIFNTNLGEDIRDFLDMDRMKELVMVQFSGESQRGK